MAGKIAKMHFSLGKFSIKSAYLWPPLKWVLTGRRFWAFSAIFGPKIGPKMASESVFFAQKHGKRPNFEGNFHHFSSFFTQISPKSAQNHPKSPKISPFLPKFAQFSCFSRVFHDFEFPKFRPKPWNNDFHNLWNSQILGIFIVIFKIPKIWVEFGFYIR